MQTTKSAGFVFSVWLYEGRHTEQRGPEMCWILSNFKILWPSRDTGCVGWDNWGLFMVPCS